MRASCLAFCIWRGRKRGREEIRDWLGGLAGKRPATASGCGGAGPSAALPLLPDAQRHRLRRGALHPAPRRSQRRSTSFFSNLLEVRDRLVEKAFPRVPIRAASSAESFVVRGPRDHEIALGRNGETEELPRLRRRNDLIALRLCDELRDLQAGDLLAVVEAKTQKQGRNPGVVMAGHRRDREKRGLQNHTRAGLAPSRLEGDRGAERLPKEHEALPRKTAGSGLCVNSLAVGVEARFGRRA